VTHKITWQFACSEKSWEKKYYLTNQLLKTSLDYIRFMSAFVVQYKLQRENTRAKRKGNETQNNALFFTFF